MAEGELQAAAMVAAAEEVVEAEAVLVVVCLEAVWATVE